MTEQKEFLRISDMMEKFNVSRKQLWNMRKRKSIPEPVVSTPPLWLAKAVDKYINDIAEKNNKEAM